jgi:hypothetical protein
MRLQAFSPMGKRLVDSTFQSVNSFFSKEETSDWGETLVLITPHQLPNDVFFADPNQFLWKNIHWAWKQIQSSSPKMTLNGWREIYAHAEEIEPGSKLFRLRDTNPQKYFCLLPDEEFYQSMDRLHGLLFSLSALWHVGQRKGLFHAAGIVRQNSAYLFVGRSGAGKSTIAHLSAGYGYGIIHDDCVIVTADLGGQYWVRDCSLSANGFALRNIFFIVQDTIDSLKPLSSAIAAQGILQGFLDCGRSGIFSGEDLKLAFDISVAIARAVPGYELHFRKSPDFWKVIDAELGL